MKTREKERRDYVIIIAVILLFGFICIILASGWALRFDLSWKLAANMNSNLNPDSDFLTSRPVSFMEPLDPSILTNPAWFNVFLTPGASFATRTPLPTVGTSTFTPIPTTNTKPPAPTPTLTATSVIVFRTSTPRPPPITFTPGGPTFTRTPTKTPILTFTPTATFTPSATATFTPTFTFTPSNTPFPSVDLQITKDDGVATYTQGGSVTYSIVITNNGPGNALGAVVSDNKPAQLTSWDWVCTSQSGGAANCDGVINSSADFSDVVDLPSGASITYTVTASISANAAGTLTNTATASVAAGYTDTNISNNSATDSDTPVNSEPDIGGPDGSWVHASPGSSVTIVFSPAIVADGDVGTPDLVYYERLATPMLIDMDWVQIEISSDGINWYQVFFWGAPPSDTNSNVDLNLVGDVCQVAGVPTETDNCSIPTSRLYNSTGITIDVDGLVPPGSYSWIRISSPPGSADGADIDAIQPYYP